MNKRGTNKESGIGEPLRRVMRIVYTLIVFLGWLWLMVTVVLNLTGCAPMPVAQPVVVGKVVSISTTDAYYGILSALNGDEQTLLAIRDNVTAYMWKMGKDSVGVVIYDSQFNTVHGLQIIDSSAGGKSVGGLVERLFATGFRLVDVDTIPKDIKQSAAEGLRNLLLISSKSSTITIVVLPIAPGLDPSDPCLLYEVMGIQCQEPIDG